MILCWPSPKLGSYSCKTWCSEESTHDRGLRDSVATRGIEWEGVLVGALDCAVTNTHCVGCFKSGLPIVNLSSSNPPRWGRLGFGIGSDLRLPGVWSSDVRAPAAHASLSSMPSSTGPQGRRETGGRDLSGDAELEGRDNHSGERSDPFIAGVRRSGY